MRVLGIKCRKDGFDWVLVQGNSRSTSAVIEHGSPSAPAGERPLQLVWVRREILELLERNRPEVVAVRAGEPGVQGISQNRAEVEGVVQEAVGSVDVPVRRIVAATLRGAFGVKNGGELKQMTGNIPIVASTAKVRHDQLLAALTQLAK